MDIDEIKEYRDHAWKYFALHAEQRLKTFHFYVILSAVISGAILTVVKDASHLSYASPICFLHFFLSYIFWKLDERNKELIKHGENALKEVEREMCPDEKKLESVLLFTSEEKKTDKEKQDVFSSLIHANFSYSDCFNSVFFVFGFCSLVLGLFLVLISVV